MGATVIAVAGAECLGLTGLAGRGGVVEGAVAWSGLAVAERGVNGPVLG